MPIYSYLCENCGVRFTVVCDISEVRMNQVCPECQEEAEREVPEDIDGVFKGMTSGVGPQNTGVSQLDVVIDRAIGEDARRGWAEIKKRNADKELTLSQAKGKTRDDLSLNPDGSYRILQPQEKAVQNRAIKINRLAMKWKDRKKKDSL